MRTDRPSEMTMWYNQPATEWVEALPVGNGRLGAMIFGSVAAERLQLNEETIWTGSPYSAVKAGGAEALGKIRELILAGKNYDAHDLFGDGTVACIPTPGHTCGHQSLRVVTANGPVILTADACYFGHTLDDGILPPFAFDFDQQRASLDMLRREHAGGTAIVPGHDADIFRRLQATPM